jgi:hypothetical protein
MSPQQRHGKVTKIKLFYTINPKIKPITIPRLINIDNLSLRSLDTDAHPLI